MPGLCIGDGSNKGCMKATFKNGSICVAALICAVMAVVIWKQNQEMSRIRSENEQLNEQLVELKGLAERLAEDKSRLTKSAAADQTSGGTLGREQFLELLRLRGEHGRLMDFERQADEGRREQMKAAEAGLVKAESALEHATRLHSKGFVTDEDVAQAEFAVEALRAQAKGDMAEAARIKSEAALAKAESDLAFAERLHAKGVVVAAHVDRARLNLAELEAQARGDTAEVARIRVLKADEELQRAAELSRKSMISEEAYKEAVRNLEAAKAAAH